MTIDCHSRNLTHIAPMLFRAHNSKIQKTKNSLIQLKTNEEAVAQYHENRRRRN